MAIARNVARYRKERGLSQEELARRIGVRQNTIAAIESGLTKKSKYLPDIARVLEVPLFDLDAGEGAHRTPTIPGADLVGARDLPLYATVEAGEGAVVMSSDPVDEVRRPAPLATVKGAYGVIVSGESMVPALRPGDTALIHPHLPPKVEDICLFISEKNGEFIATIKEYVGQTKDHWKVKRYKPEEKEFTLRKSEWQTCHVSVGRYSRR
jgi:transcriptional regulator with XRE-family HTH domain